MSGETIDKWQGIKESLAAGLHEVFPIIGKTQELHLGDVEVKDTRRADDYASQKKAVLGGSSWTAPVYGNLTLRDKQGKTLDSAKVRLLSIPKTTARGTIIYNGTEYNIANQLRLRPGVYTSVGDDEVARAQFNVGKGANFELWQDPVNGGFFMKFQQSSVPLYPVLKEIGAADSDIIKYWGKAVFDANRNVAPAKYKNAIRNVYKKLTYSKDAVSYDEAVGHLKEVLAESVIDNGVSVTPVALLEASRRILRINRKEDVPDDRESLVYKSVYGPEDFLKETITKGSRQTIWKLKSKMDGYVPRKSIDEVVTPGMFSLPVYSNLNSSSLVSVTQDANPMSLVEASNRITSFGPGGITSTHSIPETLRNIHPSHVGFLDSVRTPESDKAGIDLQLSMNVKKEGDTLKTGLVNKAGKLVFMSPSDLKGKTVAFPGQSDKKTKLDAIKDGKVVTVPRGKVDYTIPGTQNMFSHTTNLVPFLSNNAGARANMGGKLTTQALSLKYREAPLVQSASGRTGVSMERAFGDSTLPHSPVDGEVVSVSGGNIKIKDSFGSIANVDIYDNYLIGGKNYIDNSATISKGDKVVKGQRLADSNYTKDGTLALGVNLNTAYVPFKGLTHEDGIVVSESAAGKMTSQHMYRFDLDIKDGVVVDKKQYQAYFGGKADPVQMGKLDGRGIIKPGTKVSSGDYILAAMREEVVGPEDALLGRLNKKLLRPYRDISVLWEKDNDGMVVDVVVNPRRITITVRMDAALVVGDKVTNRAGGKGVVTAVLPDNEMPHDKDKKPYEIILNPATVISRMNIGQLDETMASKMATPDKPYIAPAFPENSENITDRIKREMKKFGVKEVDMVYDSSGAKVGNVFAGPQYFYKLGKTTDTNFSARAFGGGYDADMQPVRGGESGSKAIGMLDAYALLSHNARNILKESFTSKSEYNPEMWNAIRLGKPLPPPQPTFAFNKFINFLKGAGVNVDKQGDRFKLTPLTDKDTAKMSAGRITKPLMLKAKDMSEEKGGLFDVNKTGGRLGTKWSHIELSEPVLNPVFVDPARRLLGMKKKDILDLQYHRGGVAVKERLDEIDVDKRLATLKTGLDGLKGVKKDDAVKQIKYLTVLKDAGITPSEAYVMSKVPVIPPTFRPMYQVGGSNVTRKSDINELYRQVMLVDDGLRSPVLDGLGDNEKQPLRRELFNAVKVLQGLGKPETGKDYKGFISAIKGDVPKDGFFQSKILSKRQDIAGRATIGGDPELGLDEIKMPDEMAWTLYGPFVIRELVKLGMPVMGARKELEEKTEKARGALLMVMKDRPVLLNRAPTLHKFNIMAFNPKPYQGKTLLIPPMVVSGFSGDFDGDAMQVHVPVSEEARLEAVNTMMPSQNLFAIKDKSPHYAPSNEAVFGLYLGTRQDGGVKGKKYSSEEEVKRAVDSGQIKPGTIIMFNGKRTSAGSVMVNSLLPEGLRDYSRVITKKTLSVVLEEVGKKYPHEYPKIAKGLKDLGDRWAFSSEASFSFKDFDIPTALRSRVFAKADRSLAGQHGRGSVVDVYSDAQTELIDSLMVEGKKKGNKFYEWVSSGSRGKPVQFSSIWGAPTIVEDLQNRKIDRPIKRNFIEGLEPAEYYTSLYGTRKGITATKLSVTAPGALAKELVASNIDLVVTMVDCGTRKGILLPVFSRDALDRLLSADIKTGNGQIVASRNDRVGSRLFDTLKKNDIQGLMVRSVMTCEAPKGICASCAGIQENGNIPSIGENLGIKHSMSISEPLTQIALSTKHTAGMGGAGSGVNRIKALLEMPSSPNVKEVLAEHDGYISNVKKLPAGGHMVKIKSGDKETGHAVPAMRTLLKTKGSVLKGESLTDGIPNISGFVSLNGIEAGRKKLSGAIQDFYKDSGTRIDSHIPETIARGVLNYAKVTSSGDHDVVPGDIVEYNQTLGMQSRKPVTLPVSQTLGYRASKSYKKLKQGAVIDSPAMKYLRQSGLKGFEVYKEPLSVEPMAIGINKIPRIKDDWMSRMGFQHIARTITEGAAEGAVSNIHSLNPIPALSYGAEFGEGVGIDVY